MVPNLGVRVSTSPYLCGKYSKHNLNCIPQPGIQSKAQGRKWILCLEYLPQICVSEVMNKSPCSPNSKCRDTLQSRCPGGLRVKALSMNPNIPSLCPSRDLCCKSLSIPLSTHFLLSVYKRHTIPSKYLWKRHRETMNRWHIYKHLYVSCILKKRTSLY